VQFDPGTQIQANGFTLRSSRANRIIYHNDRDNIALALNEEFADLIADAQVLLVSGFNAMQSELLLQERLDSLHRILRSLPKTAAVFYEDAAFYNPAFSQRILAALASQITIFSLNEDELQAHLGRSLDLLDVEQMAQALADLHRLIPVPTLVVHSMYWAIAYGHNSPALTAALKGGVTMATTRFCYGDDFGVEAYRNSAHPFPPESTLPKRFTGDSANRSAVCPSLP
jgi:ADP-dependent phosphofructokinase/glucokinase